MLKRLIDITGQKFGRFTVLAHAPRNRYGDTCWQVRCDCGTVKIVNGAAMRYGKIVSCGCHKRADARQRHLKHDEAGKTAEYQVWSGMKNRCYLPSNRAWKYYGGRGITVCGRWRNNYTAFLADMGRRPSPQHSLDRIDNNGPYSPENCRWATRRQQMLNRSTNRIICFNGRTMTMTEWCDHLGLTVTALFQRLSAGWSIERALTEPLHDNGIKPRERPR